ncbi:MAG: pentapeptide repeat-containing protein [Alphaproteobacteria bacterium]|jgi:uncharacterized protein YjbI with pentapeptide repeats/CheY-like chemotaxis protein|nr:pentapeptide repeat-containing protein [Alphaproteobacteria bacterium]
MAGLDWSKQRILIAEHDSAIAGQIEGVLKRLGAGALRSVVSGHEVTEALSSFLPSLMLLEVNLTGMSGVDVTRWVRNNPNSPNPNVPIIVMAAAADTDALRRMCGIGIESFIRKPIDPEKLVRRVAKTIANPSRFISTLDYFGPDRRRTKPVDYRYRGAERRRLVEPKPKPEAVAPPQPKVKPAAPKPQPVKLSDEEKRQRDAEWQIAAAEEAAAAQPAPRRDSSEDWQAAMEEQKPAPAKRDSSAEWEAAVAEEDKSRAAAAAVDETPDPGEILSGAVEEHVKWLRSGGGEGAKAALAGQDLAGAECPEANLTNANLRGIDLSGANLRGSIMQGADLRGANLSGTDLSEGDLVSAKLRHADLSISRLGGAKLVDADLAGATFKGADLEDTDLRGANLLGANLQGADMRQVAGLVQAQIDKAMADRETRLPPGLHPPLDDE